MDEAEKTLIHNKRVELEKRFENEGLESFSDEECIRLLLQYAMPGKDTTEVAKRLLNCFGSFHAVFDADITVLKELDQMSDSSAALLKLVPQLARAYAVDRMQKYKVFDTLEKVGDFCVNHYLGATEEILSVILLDKNKRFMGFERLQIGAPGSASLNLEKLAKYIFVNGVEAFILVHNHNGCDVSPSEADIDTTYYVKDYFEQFGIKMLEHIIVCNDRYFPIIKYLKDMQKKNKRKEEESENKEIV